MNRLSYALAALALVLGAGLVFILWGDDAPPLQSRQRPEPDSTPVDDQRKRLEAAATDETSRKQEEKVPQEREAAANAEAQRLAEPQRKEGEDRKKKVERDAETRKEDEYREAERVAANAREAAAREVRRMGLLASPSVPAARYNPMMCAEKSAADFERSYFADAPTAKSTIKFFDVSTADGSLIVHLTNEAIERPAAERKTATDDVVRAWRESKFTRSYRFSNSVEFRNGDSVLFIDEG